MNCAVFYPQAEGAEAEHVMTQTRVAAKPGVCCECGRIDPGQLYEQTTGRWGDEWSCFKTCSVCREVRKAFFGDWTFGQLWEDVSRVILANNGENLPWRRIGSLSAPARARMIEAIEEGWREISENDGKEEVK
jgi:hypothetical protein